MKQKYKIGDYVVFKIKDNHLINFYIIGKIKKSLIKFIYDKNYFIKTNSYFYQTDELTTIDGVKLKADLGFIQIEEDEIERLATEEEIMAINL